MKYEVGKEYWRIKDDLGLYSFKVVKFVREHTPHFKSEESFIDTYYDANDKKVIADYINPPPNVMPKLDLIFDSEQKALDFLMDRIDKRKRSLDQDGYVERMSNE